MEIPTDRPITLQEAIELAFRNHGRVAVASEAVEAARQRVRQARTGTLPAIVGEVGYRGSGISNLGGIFGAPKERNGRVVAPDTVQFDQGIQPRIGVSYNIYDGGVTRTLVRQARAGVESSSAGLAAVRNDLAFQVATNYLLQLRSQRILELRQAQEALALAQLRQVEARIRADKAAAADRALPLSEWRNRQVDRIQAENDLRVAANALRNSMGLPVGPPLQLVELRESVEPLPPLPTLREIALRERPEVIEATARLAVAEAGVTLARIQRRPRLDTVFGFDMAPANRLRRSQWSVGAAISMPLWDAGLTHAREQEARTAVESAAASLEQTRKDVAAEVEEAYLNLVNARERLEAARLAVEAAQVNLEATTQRYEQGVAGIDVVDLVTAQVQFATANNNAIQALYDVHFAQAQLNRALGREGGGRVTMSGGPEVRRKPVGSSRGTDRG